MNCTAAFLKRLLIEKLQLPHSFDQLNAKGKIVMPSRLNILRRNQGTTSSDLTASAYFKLFDLTYKLNAQTATSSIEQIHSLNPRHIHITVF